jgi:pyruvate, orthophosphate dikinase
LKIDVETVARRVEQLHEANPMLGHRGCRLCITYPEILEMQVRAIIEAAIECQKSGVKVLPEIMIPLTLDRKELSILEQSTRRVADDLIKKSGIKLAYLVGTMIELPRAALLADEIAEVAEFFSYGTNDLTQTTMGLSRDDAGRFLPDYVDEKKAGVFSADPFQSLDTKGVGLLMRWGLEKGRKTRPKLKVGICGEHGGDADSVKFCHSIGMNYVSASPFRVPISRLAAAQAAIEEKLEDRKKGKK